MAETDQAKKGGGWVFILLLVATLWFLAMSVVNSFRDHWMAAWYYFVQMIVFGYVTYRVLQGLDEE